MYAVGCMKHESKHVVSVPQNLNGNYVLLSVHETADVQHNPIHVYSEINPTVFNSAYFEVSLHRIAVLDRHKTFNHSKVLLMK